MIKRNGYPCIENQNSTNKCNNLNINKIYYNYISVSYIFFRNLYYTFNNMKILRTQSDKIKKLNRNFQKITFFFLLN